MPKLSKNDFNSLCSLVCSSSKGSSSLSSSLRVANLKPKALSTIFIFLSCSIKERRFALINNFSISSYSDGTFIFDLSTESLYLVYNKDLIPIAGVSASDYIYL